jgi:hypothetical protein
MRVKLGSVNCKLVSVSFPRPAGASQDHSLAHLSPHARGGPIRPAVSSPGESHPQALSEPDMNLSAHPAPIIQRP